MGHPICFVKYLLPVDFVKAVYADHIKLGMTQKDLKEWDPKGYEAFHNRCNYAGIDPGSILRSSTEDIDAIIRQHGGVPTFGESVGRAWREASPEIKRLTRAYRADVRRRSEAKRKGPSPA